VRPRARHRVISSQDWPRPTWRRPPREGKQFGLRFSVSIKKGPERKKERPTPTATMTTTATAEEGRGCATSTAAAASGFPPFWLLTAPTVDLPGDIFGEETKSFSSAFFSDCRRETA